MDFLRIAGNETILTSWIKYLTDCNIVVETRENGKQYFCKTDAGQKLHDILKLHPYLGTLFEDLSRFRRQKRDRIITQ